MRTSALARDLDPTACAARHRSRHHASRRSIRVEATSRSDDASDKVFVFSAHRYELPTLRSALPRAAFTESRLDASTAKLASGFTAVCAFVDDDVGVETIDALADAGARLVLMRCAGVDNVALDRARERGLSVMRVPAYDPLSISEHAAAMMMSLNRHLSESRDRLRLGNFSLNGLVGTSMRGKTVGIVGTGKIGRGFAKICRDGFQMRVLGFDKFQKDDFQGEYVSLDELYAQSDVISLHLPLTPETKGLINKKTIEKLKEGVILINTSRGALVEARAAIDGLVSGRIGALGLDVYENENKLFFKDFSSLGTKERMLAWDETMAILGSMPQVLVTPHTAFLTREALNEIASTTANNLAAFFAADAPLRGDSVVVDARE